MGLEDLDCGDEAERPAPYIERKQLIPEALFKYTEPISRDSGTAPETEEVDKMEEAYNEGNPSFSMNSCRDRWILVKCTFPHHA